jgi:Tfp pilus assembly PilM family ATPase
VLLSDEVLVPKRVEDDEELGIEDGYLTATNDEIAAIFEPVIEDILKLIEGQVQGLRAGDSKAQVAAILLVGGFGRSAYLDMRVKERFEKRFSPICQVIQPRNA